MPSTTARARDDGIRRQGKVAQAVCSRAAAGRVAARDRAAVDSDHGITSRTVLATNGAMT
jgi:hypothetical protein